MRYARATFRLLALGAVIAFYSLAWLGGRPFMFASKSRVLAWRNRIFRGCVRTLAGVIGMRINVRNDAPAGSFLLVSNHVSYIDVITLASQTDCAFVAKSEIASWPGFGLIFKTMDTIFIDRSQKRDIQRVTKQIEQTLLSGLGVILFAEGTSSNGQSVLPFKSGLLEFAARNQVPVHYASIDYAVPANEPPADQSVCWWGDMTFPDHLFRLLQLPAIQANLVFGTGPVVADDRRVLAATLWSAVSALRPSVEQA